MWPLNFNFDLENGNVVLVEYQPVDEDDYGDIEFEFHVFNEAGKDFWNDISEKDRAKIQAQAGRDWEEYVIEERKQNAADQWYERNDSY